MAVTESHARQQGSGEPPVSGSPRSRRRHPWRRWIILGIGALLAAAVVVLVLLAATYQPVQFAGAGGRYPGLPTGTGLRVVSGQQIYVPPQRGVFTIGETIENTGPQAVTVEAVSILSPQEQASGTTDTEPPLLTPAGPVRWTDQIYRPYQKSPVSGRSVVSVSLPPRQSLILGIPLRMTGSCYTSNAWSATDVFYVKERFLFFTHWVAIKFQPSLLLHQPSYPNEAAKDLICLSK
jgi:hypothetical protein